MKAINPHNLTIDFHPNYELRTKMVDIDFYDSFVIVEAKEGITLSYQSASKLLAKALEHCSSNKFFYISNRKNSYSVNPNDYKYLEHIPNLIGLAIVAPSEMGQMHAELEVKFFNKPMQIFNHIEDAYQWGNNLLST